MKYAFALAALAGLASANIHARHERLHHRDAEATVTDWTVVTVTDVVTVYGPSPVAEHTAAPAAPSSHAAPSAASSPAAVSQPAAVSSPAAAPNTPAQQPTTLATVPKNEATSAAAAPSSAAAAPSSAAAAPSGGSSSGNGNLGLMKDASVPSNCPEDKPCTGDMTTYSPSVGMGACGYEDSDTSDAVAIIETMWGSLSNSGPGAPTNPLCNKKIMITNPANGKKFQGNIRDKCPKCSGTNGIDLSPALMTNLTGKADGRVPVEWYFL